MRRLSIDRQQINVFGSVPHGQLVAVMLFGFVLLAIGLGACSNPVPLPAGTRNPRTSSGPVGTLPGETPSTTSRPVGTLPVEWPALRSAVEAAGWECELPYEIVEPGDGDVECTSPENRSDGTAVVSGAEEGRVEAVTVTFEGPVPSEEIWLWATASWSGGGEAEDWLVTHLGEVVEGDVGGVHIAMSRRPVTLVVTPQ